LVRDVAIYDRGPSAPQGSLRSQSLGIAPGFPLEAGFHEDAAEDDPKRLMLSRSGAAGFPQLYFIDPDRNIVEVNGAN